MEIVILPFSPELPTISPIASPATIPVRRDQILPYLALMVRKQGTGVKSQAKSVSTWATYFRSLLATVDGRSIAPGRYPLYSSLAGCDGCENSFIALD